MSVNNTILLGALLCEPVPRTPVWMMRQAGRYLPEYREIRERAGDFLTLCTTPELACEVTLQPLRRFDLDAAILFSDILTVPHAMGLGLYFEAGEGPRFKKSLSRETDIRKLPVPDPNVELSYVMDAVRLIRRELDGAVPLIGFAGSPWTVATYMVEGGSSKHFAAIKKMLYAHPEVLHVLLQTLTRATKDYLNAQIEAGVQAVMVFDTWGGVLSRAAYQEFSLQYMTQIVQGLTRIEGKARVPNILFTKGAGARLTAMAESGCDALGVDWATDLSEARALTGDQVALQGNLDPSILYASKDVIRSQVARVLESYGRGPGHVFNLGHGIHPDVDPEHARAMVEAVHELSPQYHRPPAA